MGLRIPDPVNAMDQAAFDIVTMTNDDYESVYQSVKFVLDKKYLSVYHILDAINNKFLKDVLTAEGCVKLATLVLRDYEVDIEKLPFNLENSIVTLLCLAGVVKTDKVTVPKDKKLEDYYKPYESGSIENIIIADDVDKLKQLMKTGEFTRSNVLDKSDTPIEFAARVNANEVFALLFSYNYSVSQKALQLAFRNANSDMVKFMVQKVRITKECVKEAAYAHSRPLIDYLVEAKLAPMFEDIASNYFFYLFFHKLERVKKNMNFIDKNKDTMLNTVVRHNLDYFVLYCVSHGADINFETPEIQRPIITAIQYGAFEAFRMLISTDADYKFIDSEGQSLMHKMAATKDKCFLELEKSRNMKLDINLRDKRGRTPLMVACSQCRCANVEILLERGADPTIRDNNRIAPITMAVKYACDKTVKLLLDKKVSLNEKDEKGNDLFIVALGQKNENKAKMLLKAGVKYDVKGADGKHALVKAIRRRFTETAKIMLQKGCLVNPVFENKTAFHYACIYGDIDIIKIMLDKKVKPESMDLVSALSNKNWDAAELLIDRNCPVTAIDKGYGPLEMLVVGDCPRKISLFEKLIANKKIDPAKLKAHTVFVAIETNDYNIVRVMLEHGLNPNLKANFDSKDSLVCYACRHNCPEILDMLIKYGADINSFNSEKLNPICVAALMNSFKCIQILIDNGVSPDSMSDNHTPLIYAAIRKSLGAAKVLVKNGADVNKLDIDRSNALIHAAIENDTKMCNYLIRHGSKVDIVGKENVSLMMYIDKFYNMQIMRCALKHRPKEMKNVLGDRYNKFVKQCDGMRELYEESDDDMGEEPDHMPCTTLPEFPKDDADPGAFDYKECRCIDILQGQKPTDIITQDKNQIDNILNSKNQSEDTLQGQNQSDDTLQGKKQTEDTLQDKNQFDDTLQSKNQTEDKIDTKLPEIKIESNEEEPDEQDQADIFDDLELNQNVIYRPIPMDEINLNDIEDVVFTISPACLTSIFAYMRRIRKDDFKTGNFQSDV